MTQLFAFNEILYRADQQIQEHIRRSGTRASRSGAVLAACEWLASATSVPKTQLESALTEYTLVSANVHGNKMHNVYLRDETVDAIIGAWKVINSLAEEYGITTAIPRSKNSINDGSNRQLTVTVALLLYAEHCKQKQNA